MTSFPRTLSMGSILPLSCLPEATIQPKPVRIDDIKLYREGRGNRIIFWGKEAQKMQIFGLLPA